MTVSGPLTPTPLTQPAPIGSFRPFRENPIDRRQSKEKYELHKPHNTTTQQTTTSIRNPY